MITDTSLRIVILSARLSYLTNKANIFLSEYFYSHVPFNFTIILYLSPRHTSNTRDINIANIGCSIKLFLFIDGFRSHTTECWSCRPWTHCCPCQMEPTSRRWSAYPELQSVSEVQTIVLVYTKPVNSQRKRKRIFSGQSLAGKVITRAPKSTTIKPLTRRAQLVCDSPDSLSDETRYLERVFQKIATTQSLSNSTLTETLDLTKQRQQLDSCHDIDYT